MGDARKASAKLAMQAGIALPMEYDKKGNYVPIINECFGILQNHVPYNLMHSNVWARLCQVSDFNTLLFLWIY